MVLVRDEDVLAMLNQRKVGALDPELQSSAALAAALSSWLNDARKHVLATFKALRLPFLKPLVDDLALFWPEKAEYE